jgi:hypothetical protein
MENESDTRPRTRTTNKDAQVIAGFLDQMVPSLVAAIDDESLTGKEVADRLAIWHATVKSML